MNIVAQHGTESGSMVTVASQGKLQSLLQANYAQGTSYNVERHLHKTHFETEW
jgi:hypothetical protein